MFALIRTGNWPGKSSVTAEKPAGIWTASSTITKLFGPKPRDAKASSKHSTKCSRASTANTSSPSTRTAEKLPRSWSRRLWPVTMSSLLWIFASRNWQKKRSKQKPNAAPSSLSIQTRATFSRWRPGQLTTRTFSFPRSRRRNLRPCRMILTFRCCRAHFAHLIRQDRHLRSRSVSRRWKAVRSDRTTPTNACLPSRSAISRFTTGKKAIAAL